MVADIDPDRAAAVPRRRCGGTGVGVQCNVTEPDTVERLTAESASGRATGTSTSS